ncbi:hypothetical protein V2G26_017495 [Clonostachys chloroleuca]
MDFQSTDAHFCVSWLLGLQSQPASTTDGPEWAAHYQTDDPHFKVSYVLGLLPDPRNPSVSKPVIFRCADWAREYETNDPKFRVSWLLGLRPALRRTRRRGPRLRKSVEGAESQEVSSSDEESDDDASGKYDMFIGVAMMFGDEPYEEESSEEEETQEEAPAQTDQDPLCLLRLSFSNCAPRWRIFLLR